MCRWKCCFRATGIAEAASVKHQTLFGLASSYLKLEINCVWLLYTNGTRSQVKSDLQVVHYNTADQRDLLRKFRALHPSCSLSLLSNAEEARVKRIMKEVKTTKGHHILATFESLPQETLLAGLNHPLL